MEKMITALKWFAYGIVLGVLFAPRSGQETRQQLTRKVGDYVSQGLGRSSSVANRVSRKSQDFANQASAKVQQAADTVSQKAEETSSRMDEASQQTSEQPQ